MRVKVCAVLFGGALAIQPLSGQAPTDCRLPRGARESAVAYARRCAEHYIRAAGYTRDSSAVDTTLFARDIIEFEERSRVLAARAGTLRPRALRADCDVDGCLVAFAYANPALVCAARAVRMGPEFTELHVVHQDLNYDTRGRWTRVRDRLKPGRDRCGAT